MSRLNRARSILTAAAAIIAMAIGVVTPTAAFAAESVPVLGGLSRVSPDVVVDGDEVVFAFEFDAPVRWVSVDLLDSLGGSRYLSWSSSEPAAAGEVRASVDTAAWPDGEVTFNVMSYSWGDPNSSVGLDASGNVTWKSPGLPDVAPVGDVMDVPSFEVDSDVDLSVPPSLSGVSLVSDAVVVDGDAVEVAWTSDAPVRGVSFSFIDGVGRQQRVEWSSWQNDYQPATEGVARAVVDTASWAGGASVLDGISYSWAAGSMTLSPTGAVESKYPPGVKDPVPLAVDPETLAFAVESDVDLTPVASLVSVERVSPDVVTDGDEVKFAWETDAPVTSVGFVFLDEFGRDHYMSGYSAPATSGVTSTVVNASGWAPGVSELIQVKLTFPNGSVNLSRDGSLSSKWPSGIDDPTPWPEGFGSLDFTVESDVLFQHVSVPAPVFEDATCDSPAHLKLDDFDHGRWSWSVTDGWSGDGDESFDGVPENLRAGVPFVVAAFFDDGWGTAGKSRWSHVYVDPGTCQDQPLTSAPKPNLSGDPVVGSTLTADPGSWEPAPVDLSYRWLRNGVAIEGADTTSYVLTATDVGTAITVEVTGTKSGYLPATTAGDPVTISAPAESVPVSRVAGPDRFATAVEISKASFEPGVDVVYVANGLNFPDALAAAPVAGVQGVPVLLVAPWAIPTVVEDELSRLQPKRIVVLGDSKSVSEGVFEDLDPFTSGSVSRVAGPDRFATAVEISKASFEPGVDVVYVANGLNFPDALAAAPVAGVQGVPVLLVAPWAIPTVVEDELSRLQPKRIVVLGDSKSVSEGVFEDLDPFTSGSVSRVAGPDRFATAVEISKASFEPGVDVVYVANGLNFPDALAAAPVAGVQGVPVLLVAPWAIPTVVEDELSRLQPKRIVVLGDSKSVSEGVFEDLQAFGP